MTRKAQNDICPLGPHLQHYWDRLSDIEKRMKLDEEGLFSLTLEQTALEIAEKTKGDLVVDAFCGAGGSSIGFARAGKNVIAVDDHPGRLEMAKYNASLFGVLDKIQFVLGNCMQAVPASRPDSIFLDPPWGGTDYNQAEKFRLSDFEPDGRDLLTLAFSVTDSVVMRLPKNFDLKELDYLERPFELMSNELNGKLLHYCAFFG